uniref:Inner centromere protein ARK-binding domain-containing protein n=1 Tax=Dendroctonus ponderosae TaxID=77166 RepID=A0AAR5Q2E0_DENPD
MGNVAQDFYEKWFGEGVDTLATCLPKTAAILNKPIGENVKKELDQFSDALKKFMRTGEVDSILRKHADTSCASQEVMCTKNRRRKPTTKKLSVVTEDSPTSNKQPQIKTEKKSDVAAPLERAIKVEKSEMAAPTWIPPKKKLKEPKIENSPQSIRTTRSKTRKENRKDSDAVIQETPIPTIDLSSPQKESAATKRSKVRQANNCSAVEVASDCEIRFTRNKKAKASRTAETSRVAATPSKTNIGDSSDVIEINHCEAETLKRSRSPTTHPINADGKKIRSSGSSHKNEESDTLYEDACSNQEPPEPILETTYVTKNPMLGAAAEVSVPLNSTFLVPATASAASKQKVPAASAATPPSKNRKPGKEVFSPFDKCSTKKKVEAFEKLASCNEVPVHANDIKPQSGVKSKLLATPLRTKFMPTACSTGAVPKLISSINKQNISTTTSLSAQKDSRERMLKKQERELAYKKKQALLLQQSETKRRLNEERQIKAQQHREAEKQKQLEIQKQKEDRMKQREQEREEKRQKLKEEMEYKQLLEKKKMEEVQTNRQQNGDKPIYMITNAPPLPTEACYDSDDGRFHKAKPPSWCEEHKAKIMQLTMMAAGEKIKNTLFFLHAQTPDLAEIFQSIDPKRLKRSSSVHWKKPPRYTMMPNLNETRFTDDEISDLED